MLRIVSARGHHERLAARLPRGGFNLRCTRERYIPKNVFFLREEVLIYDAPMHPVYHAKITVSTKNFPRSEGRKNGVKGLDHVKGSRPVAWLDGMVEILVSDNKG